MEHGPELFKVRRFSLIVGIILFVYSIAGVELDTSETIRPLGIPLKIIWPKMLGLGLFLASIYGVLRYYHYGMVLNSSPWKLRKTLTTIGMPFSYYSVLSTEHRMASDTAEPILDGSMQNRGDLNDRETRDYPRYLASRYFPKIKEYTVRELGNKVDGDKRTFAFELGQKWWWKSKHTFFVLCWENLEYSAPIWVNGFAIVCYFIFKVFLDPASPASLS